QPVADLHNRSRFLSLRASASHPTVLALRTDGLFRLFSKYFRREDLDAGSFLPRISRQTGFAASLFEERGTVPAMFDGNLGQKQSALTLHADQQAMPSDLYCFRANRLGRRQDAYFNFKSSALFPPN